MEICCKTIIMRTFTILFFFLTIGVYSQEYKYLKTVEAIDISSRIKDNLLYIAWKNNNNEKVEVMFDFLIWTTDSGAFVQKMNGGGFTLNPSENLKGDYSGSFWTIPKNYNIKNLRFKFEGLKVKFPGRVLTEEIPTTSEQKSVTKNKVNEEVHPEKKNDKVVTEERTVSAYQPTVQKTNNVKEHLLATQNYINTQKNDLKVSNEIISQGMQDLGKAVDTYFQSRQNKNQKLENYKDQENKKAHDYISCVATLNIQKNYAETFQEGFGLCDYTHNREFRPFPTPSEGILDSVQIYYSQKQYVKGIDLIRGVSFRKNTKEALHTGRVIFDIKLLYTFSGYLRMLDFDYKALKKFEKNLSNNKAAFSEILNVGIWCMFKKNDTELAERCFEKLISNESEAYYKKSALLYLGIIYKKKSTDEGNDNFLLKAVDLFIDAYKVNKDEFLSLGKKTQNSSLFGVYVYEDYFALLQLALVQEIADYVFLQEARGLSYKDLKIGFDYFADCLESLK